MKAAFNRGDTKERLVLRQVLGGGNSKKVDKFWWELGLQVDVLLWISYLG